MKNQLRYILALSIIGFAFETHKTKAAPKRPNILWITCEDMSLHLGCYGNKIVKTPNLDSLATEGVRYTNVFTTAGVCAPSRSALIMGMYQQSIGTQHMRTLSPTPIFAPENYPLNVKPYSAVIPDYVKCFPEYLRSNGYYCTNNSKEDYQFESPVTVWDESSSKAHWRNRSDKNQPFFAVFNLLVTHESQVWMRAKEPLLVKPEDVYVPPYYPDTKEVRLDIARHLSNVMVMDKQAGAILQQLHEDSLDDNTLVFFYSDHGDGLPFVKREVLDRGLRVPFIIKFPKSIATPSVIRQGVDNQMISFVDLAPTVLSLANIPIPKYMQGQAFLGNQKAKTPRKYAFASRDRMDSEYDRVRSVHDGRFQYIRNYMPEQPSYQNIKFRLQQPSMVSILKEKEAGRLNAVQMQWFAPNRAVEELYDCQTDPFQFNNLINKPEFQPKLTELQQIYGNWLKKVGDMSNESEKDMVKRWWNGKNEPPTTAMPEIQAKGSKIVLSCATKGASIGYKKHQKDAIWQVFTHPFTISSGDSLYVLAQRIGFKQSEMVAKKF